MFDHAATGPRTDFGARCDELRCQSTQWLEARRADLVQAQRRLRVEELAVTRVLDERGRIDDALAAADGVSIRDVRQTVATARALEGLPTIAQVAAEGRLSDAQLAQVVKVAQASDEAEWAQRAPRWSPADLAQKAREQRTPTIDDAAARRAARELRWWWNHDQGMLHLRGALPDVDGATFELVMNQMIEGMRPAKGQPWETRERRGADALVALVQASRERRTDEASIVPGVHLVVEVPISGPATVAGIPLPDRMVETLRATARIEPVLVDAAGQPVTVGRTESVLSAKTKRVVRQRDGQCRYPGCHARTGLQIHHLWPVSWGGTDDLYNLACVCPSHHARLAPQGPSLLLGNPHNPDGLTLLDRDDLPGLAHLAADRARAGPKTG